MPSFDVEYYMSLPYVRTFEGPDDDGDIVARIRDLPGCTAHGSTREEADDLLTAIQHLYIEDYLAEGEFAVPLPKEVWKL